MRYYWGLGVGHVYAHRKAKILQPADEMRPPEPEDGPSDEGSDFDDTREPVQVDEGPHLPQDEVHDEHSDGSSQADASDLESDSGSDYYSDEQLDQLDEMYNGP